jgi:uncharacterized membrane protein YidH (DUF202 family)
VSGPVETQPARTALAWQRTGLGVLGVAALLARGAVVQAELLLVVPTAVVALAGLVVLGWSGPRRLRRTEAAVRAGADVRAPGTAALTTGLVVLTAVCALGAELVSRG